MESLIPLLRANNQYLKRIAQLLAQLVNQAEGAFVSAGLLNDINQDIDRNMEAEIETNLINEKG